MIRYNLPSCGVFFLYQAELPPFLAVVQNDDVTVSPRTLDHYLLQLPTPSVPQSLAPPNVIVFSIYQHLNGIY